jgi:hypothetical protein
MSAGTAYMNAMPEASVEINAPSVSKVNPAYAQLRRNFTLFCQIPMTPRIFATPIITAKYAG